MFLGQSLHPISHDYVYREDGKEARREWEKNGGVPEICIYEKFAACTNTRKQEIFKNTLGFLHEELGAWTFYAEEL